MQLNWNIFGPLFSYILASAYQTGTPATTTTTNSFSFFTNLLCASFIDLKMWYILELTILDCMFFKGDHHR